MTKVSSVWANTVPLTRPQDALVLGGYTAVALVLGTILLHHGDSN